MKKTVRILLLLAVFQLFMFSQFSVFAQKLKPDDVPDDVKQSLEFEYPSAKVSAWTLENNNFVATFKDAGSTGKATFKNDGTWMSTTYAIPRSELPSAITGYVTTTYPLFLISLSQLRETPNEKIHYYIEVKRDGVGQSVSSLTFNDVGNLLTRNDPPDFVDPLEEKQTEEKPVTTTKQPAAKQPAEKPAPKPAAEKPAPKPVAEKPVPKPTPVKEVEEEKEGKKREKPIKPVFDQYGNQALNSKEVPDLASKGLLKKIPRPEKLNWFKIDTFYVAKCVYREQNNEVFLTSKGVWEKTYVELDEVKITGNMLKHLNSFYRGWKFKSAVKEVRADKNDLTMVEVYERKNIKSKLITTVIFDKVGKLVRSIDPDYELGNQETVSSEDPDLEKHYEKMAMGMETNTNDDVPVEISNAFKAKYPRITNPTWGRDEDGNYLATYMGTKGKEICVIGQSGTVLQIQTIGNIDLLSSNIQNYIKQNHKGYKVDEFYAVKDLLSKKNFYKVIIINKKIDDEQVLWFDTAGKPVNM
ncbi:MAG: hypothetical protein LBV02_05570 [Bacteroidales bacterium]|jgi:hypothetical protein|nr:hypothetical protein [Bacteroidales bacterium]